MYFVSVRKQIRQEVGHMDDGLYILSRVNKSESSITGISNGKLVTKQFWNGRTDEIVQFLKAYIQTGIWETGQYFKVSGFNDVFRANSKEDAKKWCSRNGYTYNVDLVFSNNFIQISI